MSKIKDHTLAEKGKAQYMWARTHMQILTHTVSRLKKSRPLKGATLGVCLQITKETSVLLVGLQELGAKVVCCAGNPLTTQDDIAAFLDSQGIQVFAWSNQSKSEYDWCQNMVLQHKPDIITDDGGDLTIKAHKTKLKILGATEETTTGITRYQSLAKQGKLYHPIIAVNNARTKMLFDNQYGTGQSTIDGFLQAMNLLFTSKKIVVAGYGWLGKGVAKKCQGMGAKCIITEVDPIKALEAHMDGFVVMQMSKAVKIGDVFITCTGMRDIITKQHLLSMKNGAVVGNVGHFDVEIDAKFLLSQKVRQVRPNLDECVLPNHKKIYLVSKGRVANLIASEGHPPEIMALSFSNQLYSILYILKNHKKMKNQVYPVPQEIDEQIALDALHSMDVRLDKLTQKQITYHTSW
ncbi:adenosylhomocysteinase [Candidatus Nitrosotenuis cloacae]|uniref:S-adenosyl-L-homocysteine hydrolase n=1 Tax=Candidatus Nitrosotenuis cloacae TaxID=1603555 RepID=A0A3G1B3X5_9ARCH|nr:adenosylhomocysteinase [Candidatus Nitrosotenuis cloacae]AJZ76275.1 S-adenosyl-L-homocysteine hydrolase [Candidatus Nitrosotenuis cloacae]